MYIFDGLFDFFVIFLLQNCIAFKYEHLEYCFVILILQYALLIHLYTLEAYQHAYMVKIVRFKLQNSPACLYYLPMKFCNINIKKSFKTPNKYSWIVIY